MTFIDKTAEEVIESHAHAMVDIAKCLLRDNARLRRTEIELNQRLDVALEEAQTLRRHNKTMLTEFQALRAVKR